jgi:diguanylate cyclase (GGDEF)-like protein/PAS domain S-box-containing protein
MSLWPLTCVVSMSRQPTSQCASQCAGWESRVSGCLWAPNEHPAQATLAMTVAELPENTILRVLRVAGFTFCFMFAFEATKQALHPRISIWTSHAITILFTTLIATVLNIIALRKEERFRSELASNENRYRLLFERSLVGVYRTNMDGRILDCNPAFCRILGYSSCEEVVGHLVTDLRTNRAGYLSSADRARFKDKLQSENGVTNLEQCLRRKDGSTVWALNNAILIPSEDGSESVIEGTMIDITQRKHAEEDLARLAAIVRSSDDAIGSLTTAGVIETWNAGAERIYGYRSEEAIGASITDILSLSADRVQQALEILEGVRSGKEFRSVEGVHRTKSGQPIDIAFTASPIRDATREVVGVSIIGRDITERKRSEEMLQNSENKYRVLFEVSADATWLMDENGFLDCNTAALQMFGYSAGAAMLHPADISPPNQPDGTPSRMAAEQRIATAFRNGKERFEWLHQRKNGDVFPAEVCLTALTLSGHPRLLATVRDITERKKSADRISAQQSILDEERKMLRALIDHIPDFMYVKDRQSRFVVANVHTARAMGANCVEELIGRTDFDFFPRELATAYHEDEQTVMRSGQPLYNREEKVVDGKGGETYILTTKVPLQDSTGRVNGVAGVGRDITERKRSEEALLFKTALLEAQAETTIDGILAVDEFNHIILANKQFGLTFEIPDELLSTGDDLIVREHVMGELVDPDTFVEKVNYLYSHRDEKSRDELRLKTGKILDRYSAPLVDSKGRHRGRIWYFRDVTDSKQAEEALRESSERVRILLDSIPEGVYGIDLDGKCTFCNPSCLRLLGYERASDLLGRDMHAAIHHARADGTPYPVEQCHIFEAFRRGSGTHIDDEVLWRRDGTSFSSEYWSHPMQSGGEVVGAVVTFVDITERKRTQEALRNSEQRYRLLFERNMAGVLRTTVGGRVLECNQATARIFGYDSPEEVLVLLGADFYHESSDWEAFVAQLKSEKSLTNQEIRYRRKDGNPVWVIANYSLANEESGGGGIVEGTLVDITERKIADERIQYLAYYDGLTGLPNRTLLQDRLGKALASARRQKGKVALLFLDLDRFKVINDSLGHSVGDLLLQEVARRLKRWAREQDTVARLGGDEFLLVLTGVKEISDVAVAAERLMDTMTAEFVIRGHALSVSCSLGISIFPESGGDVDTLVKHADAAMYSAKEAGRNRFYFFTDEMNRQAQERLILENSLRHALSKKELFLMYQPQIDMVTGSIIGVEALLRWRLPGMGLVSPDRFIRIAENSGLIIPIGEWALRTACSQARKWQDEGLPTFSIAVNVSAVQFRQENFPAVIGKVLRETGLAARYLELELTESLLLSNADVTFSVLRELKAMGLTLAIDDFGTGYSSLSYLRQFPVSKLKIDRSFIREVAQNPDDAAIAAAIIRMAKSLNLKVIAEGVENEEQMSFLRTHQCDEIQGYYFSKPLSPNDFVEKLKRTAGLALSAKHEA